MSVYPSISSYGKKKYMIEKSSVIAIRDDAGSYGVRRRGPRRK